MSPGSQLEFDFNAAPIVPDIAVSVPDQAPAAGTDLPAPAGQEPLTPENTAEEFAPGLPPETAAPETAAAEPAAPVPVRAAAPNPSLPPFPKPSGEPLGIRMVNEFVYCPRLFYYEVVEGVFVHNPDTLEGAEAHKRVDTAKPGSLEPAKSAGKKKKPGTTAVPGGPDNQSAAEQPPETPATPDAPAEPDTIHARSVSLYSPLLNVTAKLDLVEGEAVSAPGTSNEEPGTKNEEPRSPRFLYTPVEYKKGRPREGDEGRELWDADRVQLMLQILLLRENGFPSEEGIVFYKETRQRVTFRPNEDDAAWARRMVAEAYLARTGPMPPPLEHSPKCPRCSLAGICLPDETRMLSGPEAAPALPPHDGQLELALTPEDAPPPVKPERSVLIDYVTRMPAPGIRRVKADPDMRRLIAPNPETRTLYLNTPGAWVGKSGETITVKEKDKLVGEFLLKDLHHVALFGPVQISTAVVQALCEAEIPLTYFSTGGWFYGLTRGHTLKNVLTRIEQFRTAGDDAASLALARMMIHGKIVNQRTLLMRNHLEPPKDILHGLKYFAHAALLTTGLPQLLGVEGNAAGLYFSSFGGMLKVRGREGFAGERWGEAAPEPTSPAEVPGSPHPDSPPLTDHRSPGNDGGVPLFPFFPDSRNRRPPRDPVNALLSLTYSLLSKECTLACHAVGLDPYVGFMHQPRHGRPALALDIMEEFRPLLADSTVITLLNNGMLTEKDFVISSQSAALTPAGRKTVFTAWERRLADAVTHPLFGYKVSYRRAVELQVRILAKSLTGEIRDYVPFMTR